MQRLFLLCSAIVTSPFFHLKLMSDSSVFFCSVNSSMATNDVSASVIPGPDTAAPPLRLLDLLIPEAVLAFFLLLLLVWFLNREFEVSYRLHYHGNVEADKHRSKIQTMRDQAEWLLGNIIPIHVADQLKVFVFLNGKYQTGMLEKHAFLL